MKKFTRIYVTIVCLSLVLGIVGGLLQNLFLLALSYIGIISLIFLARYVIDEN